MLAHEGDNLISRHGGHGCLELQFVFLVATQLVKQQVADAQAGACDRLGFVLVLLQRGCVVLQGEVVPVVVHLHLVHIVLDHPLPEGGVGHGDGAGRAHGYHAAVEQHHQQNGPDHDADKAQGWSLSVVILIVGSIGSRHRGVLLKITQAG